MGHEEDGLPAAAELADLVQALAGKGFVPHGQHLVDEQHLGIHVDGHGKPQPRVHARGVGLHGGVDEALELREGHDVREALLHLAAGQAEHDAVDVDVLAAADLGVEARAQLDEGGDAALHLEGAPGGLGDPGEELQEGGLPGAVLPDHPEGRALLHLEAHPVECGEGLVGAQVVEEAAREERALQGLELVLVEESSVDLREVLRHHRRGGAHTSSARVSRKRSKKNAPNAKTTRATRAVVARPRQWSKCPWKSICW